jgi:hypothetical protein
MRCPVSVFRSKVEVPMTRIEVAFEACRIIGLPE